MTRRFLTGGAAAVATLLFAAGTALGGGWATITADDADQPRAGETDAFGFTVLQHGQTPVSWVKATLIVENIATGKTLSAAATPQGAEGHFVANVTFPEAGYWSWHVEITDLIAESPPRMMTVLTAEGALPPFDPTIALAMVEGVKSDMRSEFEASNRELQTALDVLQGRTSLLEGERDVLAGRLKAAESAAGTGAGGDVPIAATLALAVLGGAIAGFVMASLGRRGGRTEADITRAPEYVAGTR